MIAAGILAWKLPEIRQERAYKQAVALLEAEDYEAASVAFSRLGDYKDSGEKASKAAEMKINSERAQRYKEAEAALLEGDFAFAITEFEKLGDFGQSAERAMTVKADLLRNAQIGDIIYWGHFEQNCEESDGPENIEWIVLDVEDDKLLVISKKVLSRCSFSIIYNRATWWVSNAKNWLNKDFYDQAFTVAEKSSIKETIVSPDPNPNYNTYQGKESKDRIFLLSVSEAEKYFSSDEKRSAEPTKYVELIKNGYGASSGNWWLRTSGKDEEHNACVNSNGRIVYDGIGTSYWAESGIRPAMWIDLDRIGE